MNTFSQDGWHGRLATHAPKAPAARQFADFAGFQDAATPPNHGKHSLKIEKRAFGNRSAAFRTPRATTSAGARVGLKRRKRLGGRDNASPSLTDE
jgi:hypothetical protein